MKCGRKAGAGLKSKAYDLGVLYDGKNPEELGFAKHVFHLAKTGGRPRKNA